MPACAISTCKNTGRNIKDKNVSFFHFPREFALRKVWLNACRRADNVNVENAIICSQHFKPEEIKGTLQEQLLGTKIKKFLISNAVPTLFLPSQVLKAKPCQSASQRNKRNHEQNVRRRAIERLIALSPQEESSSDTEHLYDKDNVGKSSGDSGSLYPDRCSLSLKKDLTYGGEWCSAINCSKSRRKCPGLSFFRFPKDPERSKKWILNTGRKDLLDKSTANLANYVLCADHFEDSQCMNPKKKRLIWNAIPTLFSLPNPPSPATVKRPWPRKRDTTPWKKKSLDSTPASPTNTCISQQDSNFEQSSTRAPPSNSTQQDPNLEESHVTLINVTVIQSPENLTGDARQTSKVEMALRKEVVLQKATIYHLKRKVMLLERERNDNLTIDTLLQACKKYFSTEQQAFFEHQLRSAVQEKEKK